MIVTATQTTVLKHFHSRFAEWFNAGFLTCWGIYVIMHPGMMSDPRVAAIWVGLLRTASQETWGLAAVIVGVCRLGALYINGAHKRTPMIRLIASFFSAFIITQIVVGMFNGTAPNTGLIAYPAFILADIYSAFRASADMTFVARRDSLMDQSELNRVVSHSQRS